MNNKEKKEKLQVIAIALLVVALGLFCINQFMTYKFNSKLLLQPCQLCREFNPNQSKCIDNCFNNPIATYPNAYGELQDLSGKCYNLDGKETNCPKFDKDNLLIGKP